MLGGWNLQLLPKLPKLLSEILQCRQFYEEVLPIFSSLFYSAVAAWLAIQTACESQNVFLAVLPLQIVFLPICKRGNSAANLPKWSQMASQGGVVVLQMHCSACSQKQSHYEALLDSVI